MAQTPTPLLDSIYSPADLRKLDESLLPDVAADLRTCLIDSLNQTGGHFAANLGTVELAIALHYVFDTPEDRLIWDVGHQAYPHKILTERRHKMGSLRQLGGIAPFPSRSESPYDAFGVGHASTSISAALGMSIAAAHASASPTAVPRKTIAIIGDGAMTAGLAFEALNHAGAMKANLLVILNDNDMSISENVGALSNYFARILSGKLYTSIREGSKKFLNVMPPMKALARRAELHMKGMVVPGTLFEELGFNYLGPFDGHSLPQLVQALQNVRDLPGPRLIHVVTKKGKGYPAAELDPIGYHAVSPGFNQPKKPTPSPAPSSEPTEPKPISYSQVFGDWLCHTAATEPALIGITPAMREGSGMVQFAKEYPAQYIDVGIAEQHSVTLAAGLACEGVKPVVAIYSTFLQRAYDQLIHDVALQNLPVLFALDRAGIVGADGPTHQGSFDLSFLRCVPNLVIMAPSDGQECHQMLTTGFYHAGPAAVRYPRGVTPAAMHKEAPALPIGRAKVCRTGEHIAILAFGSLLAAALEAGAALNATVVNMRFVKPLDATLLDEISKTHSLLVTCEENAVMGGAGSGVNEWIVAQSRNCRVLNLGLPDQFLEHGDPKLLLAQCGLDANGLVASIQKMMDNNTAEYVSQRFAML